MECYICGNNDFLKRPGTVRDNKSLDVIECKHCGLVTLSSTDHLSSNHYEEGGMHGEEPVAIKEWLQVTDVDDQRRFDMLKQKIANKTVLDFGCGCGGFLLKAKDLAASVEGLELEERLQPFFNESGIKVWTQLDELIASGKKFDLITSFHVFEHLVDPKDMLNKLTALLSEKGELIIEVPSGDDALLTLYKCEAFTNFTYWSQHLFLFNQHTLNELVKQAGLDLRWQKQVQRYSLANHLYWLSNGEPGGHHKWVFMDNDLLNEAYGAQLAALGKCDTLLAGIGRKK